MVTHMSTEQAWHGITLVRITYISLVFMKLCFIYQTCPVSWGCRIHWLHLCREVRPPPQRVSWYDIKQSHDDVPVMLEFRGMQSTLTLPSLPGPLWPGGVAPNKLQSMGQIEVNCILLLNWIAWNGTVFVC